MRIMRLGCRDCKFYSIEGISERCKHPTNLDSNWLGVVYMKHPEELNRLRRCENYEEAD